MKKIYELHHKGPAEYRWKFWNRSRSLSVVTALYHYYRKNTSDRHSFRVVSYALTDQKVISKSP